MTITLIHTSSAWLVDFSQTDDAGNMRHLFGTCILPTPFTGSASYEMVRARIQQKNPGFDVV
jgi:hypothetical protein